MQDANRPAPRLRPVVERGHGTAHRNKIDHSCSPNQKLDGSWIRKCRKDGTWSGQQTVCQKKVVDCGPMPTLANGRVFHINSSTEFGSLVEHYCLPSHRRQGASRRQRLQETLHCRWHLPGSNTVCVPRFPNATTLESASGPVDSGPDGAEGSASGSDAADAESTLQGRSDRGWFGAVVAISLSERDCYCYSTVLGWF